MRALHKQLWLLTGLNISHPIAGVELYDRRLAPFNGIIGWQILNQRFNEYT